jgi:dTDP-4-amino-4,6-dideoxygalactose transaminase
MERSLNGTKNMIGGEFEFKSFPNISNNGLNKLTNGKPGTWTTNGRCALYLILQHFKQQGGEHVHLPAFLCQSILQPVLALELDYSFYPVQTDLAALPDPTPDSAVLLIHYFGFINNAMDLLRHNSGQDYYLIEDASHVLLNERYSKEFENQYVFFSTRKYGPTVLGGWCNLEMDLDDPEKDTEVRVWKSFAARLLKGLYLINKHGETDSNTEDYYLELFREVEDSFNCRIQPTKLPKHIVSLIDSIHWDTISRKRRDNWQLLHELIGNKVEPLFDHLPDGSVPLGYVIRLKDRDIVKDKLAAHRIFAPIHWLLPEQVDRKKFPDSAKLSDSLLSLPIDQRYGEDEINYISEALIEVL